MADEVDRRSAQERQADLLAELLDATAGETARRTPRWGTSAVSPELVDAVTLLLSLAKQLRPFCARAVIGDAESDEWGSLAVLLSDAARRCRAQVVIDNIVEFPKGTS